MNYIIRRAKYTDLPQMTSLFHNTLSEVNINDYTIEKIEAWQQKGSSDRWKQLWNSNLLFFVAEMPPDKIIGFTSVSDIGYINSMFVHFEHQRHGIASTLLYEIYNYARSTGIKHLNADVSITAKPFFEQHGFTVTKENSIDLGNGINMTNFTMGKSL